MIMTCDASCGYENGMDISMGPDGINVRPSQSEGSNGAEMPQRLSEAEAPRAATAATTKPATGGFALWQPADGSFTTATAGTRL